jgi:hypothetical protein
MKAVLSCMLVGFCLTLTVSAKDLTIEPDQKYFMLETTKTSTMQKELTEVASQGFRVVVGGPTSTTNVAILTERVATPPDVYEYKLLAASKAKTLEKEMNEAGAAGFKLIPSTLVFKEQLIGTKELVAVMEREPKSKKRYDYKLFSWAGSEFRKNMASAIADGYKVVGMAMTAWAGDQVIIEKASD